MKMVLVAVSVVGLQACVVAPPQPVPVAVQQPPGVVLAPLPDVMMSPGVVYVAPTLSGTFARLEQCWACIGACPDIVVSA